MQQFNFLRILSASLFVLVLNSQLSKAQLVVDPTLTDVDMVNLLLGTGVQAFNISYTGAGIASGEFDRNGSNIGLVDGVLLSSGSIGNAIGPNDCDGTPPPGCGDFPSNLGQAGDPDLAILAGALSNDASILEFDFVPSSDTVRFNYIFGSEEYPEFVCSFNDVFGFFLSGPGISGGGIFINDAINIAIIPGTSTPVSIDSVNWGLNNDSLDLGCPGQNTQYYVNNGTGTSADADTIQYDGFTVVLTAVAAVIPCDTFHIKLAVSDAGDFVYDSGVFLEANSFSSGDVTVTADFGHSAPKCVGEGVDFLDNSAGALNFSWDFGVGATPATSTLQNPTGIVYSSPGLKLVTLISASCSDADTITKVINILDEPIASFTPSSAVVCMGDIVSFANTGSTGGGWTYAWDFGAGAVPATSTAENPSGIQYTTPGTKTITFTISNANCDSTVVGSILVNITPIADFFSTAPGCTGTDTPVDFVNTGTTGGGTLYDWSFDLFGTSAFPGTSIAENPAGIVYDTSGSEIKYVRLVTTLGTCVDSSIQTINITEKPIPAIAPILPACEGTAIDFNYAGTNGVSWTFDWDFGAGASPAASTVEDPVGIVYSGAGPKTVTLTVTNGICSDTVTLLLTIDPTPVADFASTAPSCTGDSVDFANTGTTGATYLWDFGLDASPAASTDENPTGIIYSTDGIKTVSLTTTLGFLSCVDASIQTINITETPAPGFTLIADTCEGAAIDFTYTGTTDTNWTYQWDFGTGANPPGSTIQNPLGITYTGPESKTVTLTVANGLCTEVFVQTHTIFQTPVADFTSTAPSCTGDSVDFANTGTTGATYLWNFGLDASPASSTDENPTGIIYSTDGIKTVSLTTTLGLLSCVDASIQTINITETPAPGFAPVADTCEGIAIDFIYTGTTDTNWTYQWDFGTGANPPNSTVQNPLGITYTGTGPGSKTVTLTVANGICTEVFVQTHTILQTPVADFTSTAPTCTGDSVDFANTGTTGATSYNWAFDVGGVSAAPATFAGENPPRVVYSTDGIKTVKLITTLGSCVDSITQTINITETPAPGFALIADTCEGAAIDFTYTGTTDTNWTYQWDFGAGANPPGSTVQNPVGIEYSGAGSKTVTLTVANGMCTEVFAQTHTILQTPVADFTSTAPTCTGDTVDFANTGTIGATYLWDFGLDASPATSTDENPAGLNGVSYTTAGIKTVRLITTLGSCVDTSIQTININLTPSVSFTSNTPVCAGVGVNFINGGSTGGNWTFDWDFGAGAAPAKSTAENPLGVIYSYGGTKTVTFTITDGICLNTSTDSITINTLPIADAGPDTTICADQTVQIGSASIGSNTYSWFPSSVLLPGPSPAEPIAAPIATITTYIVTVTDIITGCQNVDSVVVTMVTSALVDAGPDVEMCFGDALQIGSALVEGQTYAWTPTAGLDNPAMSNPIASPDSTTLYTVSVMYENCPPITDDVLATVHPLPDAKATDSQGRDTTYITLGSSVQLIATGGMQYEWTPETGLDFADIYNPVASPDSTTNYVAAVTDLFGCVNRDTVRVEVDSLTFFIPTAFTPDGNGISDIFFVRIAEIVDFELIIFDRWGEQLFISRNVFVGWDGTKQDSGKELPEGAYVYSFKGTTVAGKEFSENGIINLIR